MRAQGSGHIIQVSSIGGITAFTGTGAYHASKWALEGFSQSLAQEVAGFGIHVTLIEPGGYSTDWAGPSATRSEESPAYAAVHEAQAARRAGNVAGDPTATRGAILKVVDAAEPPLRIFFGTTPLATATRDYESRLATWNEWQPVSVEAFGAPQAPAAEFRRGAVIWSPDGARRPPRHVRGGDLGIAGRARRIGARQEDQPPGRALP